MPLMLLSPIFAADYAADALPAAIRRMRKGAACCVSRRVVIDTRYTAARRALSDARGYVRGDMRGKACVARAHARRVDAAPHAALCYAGSARRVYGVTSVVRAPFTLLPPRRLPRLCFDDFQALFSARALITC